MSTMTPDGLTSAIRAELERAPEHRLRTGRPFCTLTYAQSLDGCIAMGPLKPAPLSGLESLTLTHRLRSWHAAILVGIRTVVSDNPRLNVRLVSGRNPQPVVLDSRLNMPGGCNLVEGSNPWIATGLGACPERQRELEARGARVFRLPTTSRGWVRIEALLERMGEFGIDSIMVEGGARVITSFLRAGMVDQLIVTVAPVVMGGVRAFLGRNGGPPSALQDMRWAPFGKDLVLWGKPEWGG